MIKYFKNFQRSSFKVSKKKKKKKLNILFFNIYKFIYINF